MLETGGKDIQPPVGNAPQVNRDATQQQVNFQAENTFVQAPVGDASTVNGDAAQQQVNFQAGNPLVHPPGGTASQVNSDAAQQQASPQAVNPFFRKTAPAKQSYYTQRLQCLLMNHLQEALQDDPLCPKNFFIQGRVIEELIYHKELAMDNPILYEFGLTSLPGVNHIDISIYVYKVAAGLGVRGRNHYRVDAFAVGFNETGWMINGAYGDLCRGFLSMEWYNDKSLYTFDWDRMEFQDLLRLLRRAAMRNFDDHGNLRSAVEQLRMEAELGDLYPGRIGQPSALAPNVMHTFPNRGLPLNNLFVDVSTVNSPSVQ
jgi:hypothetical protein